MQRASIGLGKYGYAADTEVSAGADYPDGDFAPIGYENLIYHQSIMFAKQDMHLQPQVKRFREIDRW
jgi:hypothetical protein